MTRPNPRILFAVAAFTALVACARHESAADMEATTSEARMEASPIPAEAAATGSAAPAPMEQDKAVQGPGVEADQVASSANTVVDPRRRFVRTAQASFQVKDVYASTLAIEDAVAAEGGFVAKNEISTQTSSQRERPIGDEKLLRLSEVTTRGTLSVRVPSDRAQAFLRSVARQMQFLDARSFEASDLQFEMLRRELAYARAQELQQAVRSVGEQPGKTGEKVDAVQARAEMLAARDEAVVAQRELEDRIAFATLAFTLYQPAQVREQVVPDTEAILRARGPGFFAQAGEAIAAGWRGLLQALVVAIQVWPLWLVLGAAWWLVRLLRRGRRVPVAAKAAASNNAAE